MSVGPRLGKISKSEFQSTEMPVGSGRHEEREWRISASFIPFRNVYWGYWVTAPHSLVLGGILGNVVFCWNMVATCSTYTTMFDDDVISGTKTLSLTLPQIKYTAQKITLLATFTPSRKCTILNFSHHHCHQIHRRIVPIAYMTMYRISTHWYHTQTVEA